MISPNGAGLGPRNQYRVVWPQRPVDQADPHLLSREDAIVAGRVASQMNPGVPHWIERLDGDQHRFLRDEQATSDAGLQSQNRFSRFCAWFARLFDCVDADNAQNHNLPQPVDDNIPLVAVSPDAPVMAQRVELPREFAVKEKLLPDEQAGLFFPGDANKQTRDDSKALFETYPQIAQYLWEQFRSAHQFENVEHADARLARVRQCTQEQIRDMRDPNNAFKVQAFEESL
jgi:hypothetical protein